MIEADSQATEQVGRSTVSAATIRLLIAEDHPVMRYTLCSVLKQYPDIEIVGEATNGEDAVLRAARASARDCPHGYQHAET